MALPNGPVTTSSEAEAVLFDLVDVYDRAYEAAAAELSLSPAQACVLGRLDERRGMGALAEELGCDLIALGTHGRTGLDRLLAGSVAEAVLRRARCPVLALRSPPHLAAMCVWEGSADWYRGLASAPYSERPIAMPGYAVWKSSSHVSLSAGSPTYQPK